MARDVCAFTLRDAVDSALLGKEKPRKTRNNVLMFRIEFDRGAFIGVACSARWQAVGLGFKV
ncbi:hypothetical protein Mal52_34610 [Symmachiella dynata]|uniref:Uncharacterized protein n=1 Tax=Symmachiella dynata TaxID=2527995 RepID=A0A517ZRC6_9PLAN|nr:hypothetical protein Mal52_34610 [Symmachiella dynata]